MPGPTDHRKTTSAEGVAAPRGRAANAIPLEGIEACAFDAYGTLFDYASAAAQCRDVLGERLGALTALWRDKQVQYTWLRTLQGRHADFWQVTRDALEFSLETLEIPDHGLADRLMNLYLKLDVFPEVPAVLAKLKEAGVPTAILSNGTRAMLDATIAHAGIGHLIGGVLSIDAVGAYKTDPRVYRSAVDHFGVPAERIAFQSANAWDAYAASAFGMRVVWCNRYGQRPERLPGKPDRVVGTLADLPALVGA
jgi:2-haloacid dehalogenase